MVGIMRHRCAPSRSLAALAAAVLTALSGCAINPQTGQPEIAPTVRAHFVSIYDSPNPCSSNGRNIGMTVGTAAGALLGAVIDKQNRAKGAMLGAGAGLGAGYLIGHLVDARRCRLYKIAQANHLRMASAAITPAKLGEAGKNAKTAIGLDVQLQDEANEFESGSAILTPQAQHYMTQIAQQYTPQGGAANLPPRATPEQRADASPHIVLIVGHTDAEDAAAGADLARLSQARAKAVAEVFARNGVPPRNIYYQGAGDALPIASNASARGRTENNRVQFVDLPSAADLQRFLRQRSANPVDYQTAAAVPASASIATRRASRPVQKPEPPRTTRHLARQPGSPSPQLARSTPHEALQRQKRPMHVRRTTPAPASSCCTFGGSPAPSPGRPIAVGAPLQHSMFNIIPSANAAEPLFIGSCLTDHPHPTTAVRNLQTGQALPPRDFVRGFYGTVWAGYVHGNLVAITHATVPLDSGAPVPDPTVYIYKGYRGNSRQAPSLKTLAAVNVYRGTRNLVYRLFLHGPAQCLDLIVPTNDLQASGDLYYDRTGDIYLASTQFAKQH